MTRREAQMINPIRQLLYDKMFIDITQQEFSAGYGFADIVGAKLCSKNCQKRENLGLAIAFDHVYFASVLLSLSQTKWTSFANLAKKVAASEITLRKKILPKLNKLKIIEKNNDFFRMPRSLTAPLS